MVRDRLDRVQLPDAVSPDSMTASVPSRMALATSDDLGAGRARLLDHADSSIWVAVMTILPRLVRLLDDPLLDERDLLRAHLHAEVATGDHDAVGGCR
jgi:hypothetical protein